MSHSPYNHLIRALIPSWRFFDDLGEIPTLWVRVLDNKTTHLPWTRCLQTTTRQWRDLLSNPLHNRRLACHALLEQFWEEIDEGIKNPISQSMVERLAREEALKLLSQPPASVRYQFKLMHNGDEVCLSSEIAFNP